MRTLVRSNNIKDCQQRVKVKEKEGWKAITEVKLDTSGDYDTYVCVMERPDNPGKTENQNRWNRRLPIW